MKKSIFWSLLAPAFFVVFGNESLAAETVALNRVSVMETSTTSSVLDYSGNRSRLRIQAGSNLADIKISGSDDSGISQKSNVGISFGMGYEMPLSYSVSFLPELIYTQKGTAFSEQNQYGSYRVNMNLNYLQMPLLMKVGAGSGDVRPYIVAGPYVAVKVSTKASIEKTTGMYQGFTSEGDDEIEGIKTFDYGLLSGVGMDFSVSPKTSLGVSARYELGLANIVKDPEPEDGKIRNRVWAFTAGFSFLL